MIERIKAVLIQEYYISYHSIEVWMDNIFFPVMTALVFGLIAKYLSGENGLAAEYLILGMSLWFVIQIAQYSISLGALWNVWSRNLTNMFISPLSVSEYMAAQIISSFIKASVIFGSISVMYNFVFDFNILKIGYINFFFYIANLLIFSWAIGIILLGVVFKWGTRIQALAWGAIFLFQPLAAVFFPVSVLPPAIQVIALAIPVTYVFEGARANISDPYINWQAIAMASILNVLYVFISVFIFKYLFKNSRETGQFARNEG